MRRRYRGPLTMLAAGGCVAALATAAIVPDNAHAATTTSICTSARHPRIAGRISHGVASVLAQRPGSFVGLAVSDPALGLTCSLRQSTHFYAASVVKVTILGSLLLKVGGPRHLTRSQRHLAFLMITQSSNSAATTLWNEVGISNVQRFLNRAGLGQTILNRAWGLTRITAHDELRLLQLLTTSNTVLGRASRGYMLSLMAQVVSYERWGVSAGAPSNVTVHIKNGWLPYPRSIDWRINSIGAFTGTGISYQIVILTAPPGDNGQGESYGIQTIQLAASVINRNLTGTLALGSTPPSAISLDAPGG
jgi:Beta-lactamase enzyme family